MDEKFRKAEDEYFVLRGKLDTGRIGKNLFELALRDLMVQDAQGRWWMLGPDTGNWYMHDGKSWVEANPAHVQVAKDEPTAAPPKSSPGVSSSDAGGGSNRLPLIAGIGCLALLCIGVLAAAGFGLINVPLRPNNLSSVAFNTPLLPLTTPTFISSVASTATATTSPTSTEFPSPTVQRVVVRPSSTLTPAFAPGVYVTSLRLDPPQPKRKYDVTFYPTFLNTTGVSHAYRIVMYIYRPDQVSSRSMGETAPNLVTVVQGTSEASTLTWVLSGPGGCEDFVARLASWDDLKNPTFFTLPSGQIFQIPITVCP